MDMLSSVSSLGTAGVLSYLAAGSYFLTGLCTGAWKYWQIENSPNYEAHPYVDIAHRSALLYAFAAILLAEFTQVSALSPGIETLCVSLLLFYFTVSIASYIVHGAKRDTDNQFKPPHGGKPMQVFMLGLIVAEIGAFAVLFYGVIEALA